MIVVSTDLDGTLLDHHTYRWDAALPALSRCKAGDIPVVLNTSKTLAEVTQLHQELALTSPVIVENGSALVMPDRNGNLTVNSADDDVIRFGVARSEILEFIETVRRTQPWQFTGFNDWQIDEICVATGLSDRSAELAAKKEYSEPFLWQDSAAALEEFSELAERHGLQVLRGGRFYHLQGRTDKAQPLRWLRKNLAQLVHPQNEAKDITCTLICLGDNHNDVAMLNEADYPVCVKSPVAEYPPLTTNREILYTAGEGPVGWNKAVNSLLDQLL